MGDPRDPVGLVFCCKFLCGCIVHCSVVTGLTFRVPKTDAFFKYFFRKWEKTHKSLGRKNRFPFNFFSPGFF